MAASCLVRRHWGRVAVADCLAWSSSQSLRAMSATSGRELRTGEILSSAPLFLCPESVFRRGPRFRETPSAALEILESASQSWAPSRAVRVEPETAADAASVPERNLRLPRTCLFSGAWAALKSGLARRNGSADGPLPFPVSRIFSLRVLGVLGSAPSLGRGLFGSLCRVRSVSTAARRDSR